MLPDPRKVVGGRVQAKALHVSNLAECARRYGAHKGTKVLMGIVVEVSNVVNPTSHRTSTFITADFDLGGGTIKRARLNIRSVKADPLLPVPPPLPPVAPTPTTTPVILALNPHVNTAVMTAPATPPQVNNLGQALDPSS